MSFLFPPFVSAVETLSVERTCLQNGAILLQYLDPNQKTVAIDWLVHAGSAGEGKYLGSGISHFLEHMVFKGAEGGQPGVLVQQIRAMGGEVNAGTGFDYTHYYVRVPKESYLSVLRLLAQAILQPTFFNEEFEKERGVILRELDLRQDQPDERAYQLLLENAFQKHNYRYPTIGIKERFQRLTLRDLKRFYASKYRPDAMVISVVGNVEPNDVKTILEDMFKNRQIKGSLFSEPSYRTNEPQQLEQRRVELPSPFKTSKVLYGFKTPGFHHEDFYALEVLAMILGEGRSSRLYQRLIDKGNKALSVSASHDVFDEGGLFVLEAACTEDKRVDVEKLMWEEIDSIKRKPAGSGELDRARKTVRQVFLGQRELPESLAFSLTFFESFLGSYHFLETFPERLLAVTASDVRRVAERYLNPRNATCLITEGGCKVEKTPLAVPTAVVKEIERVQLSSGATLLLKKDRRVSNIALQVFLRGGSSFETDQTAGVTRLLSNLMIRRTQRFGRAQLQEAIESLGSSIHSFVGNNSFGFSITVLPEDVKRALSLINEILYHPQFEEGDLEKEKEFLLGLLQAEQDHVFALADRTLREHLFQRHPYRFPVSGSVQAITKIQLRDVLASHKRFVADSDVVLCVFGDIRYKEILDQVEALWSKRKRPELKKVGDKTTPYLPACEVEQATERNEAIVMIGMEGTSVENLDRYALMVWEEILGGSDGLLMQKLREEKGWVYTTGADQMVGLRPGYFALYAACSPEKVASVRQRLEEVILNLETICTDEHIERAKKGLVGSWMAQSDSKQSLAFQTGLNEALGLGYEEYLKFPERLAAVNREVLMQAAKRYFQKEKFHVVVLKPK